MSGGATVVFWMLFRRASSGYPHRCLLLNDAPSQTTEGLRFHVKLDAVYKRHCPNGHVCRTIVEARCSRNGAGTGVTKSCLDPTRTISAGIVTAGQSIGTFGILSVSRETCL